MAQAKPTMALASEPGAAASTDCQAMQATPAAPMTREGTSRCSGTAPWSRLPITVTATGRKPTTTEVMATPPICTALARRT